MMRIRRLPGTYYFANAPNNFVERFVNLGIPYAQDAPAQRSHINITVRVMVALGIRAVRSAVDLNDKMSADSSEVGDVRSDGMLPPESHA